MPHTEARNRKNATVKIQQNPLVFFPWSESLYDVSFLPKTIEMLRIKKKRSHDSYGLIWFRLQIPDTPRMYASLKCAIAYKSWINSWFKTHLCLVHFIKWNSRNPFMESIYCTKSDPKYNYHHAPCTIKGGKGVRVEMDTWEWCCIAHILISSQEFMV